MREKQFIQGISERVEENWLHFQIGKTGYLNEALADLDRIIALNFFQIPADEQLYYTHQALGN